MPGTVDDLYKLRDDARPLMWVECLCRRWQFLRSVVPAEANDEAEGLGWNLDGPDDRCPVCVKGGIASVPAR